MNAVDPELIEAVGRRLAAAAVLGADPDRAVGSAGATDLAVGPVDVRLIHRTPDERWGGLGGAVADGTPRGCLINTVAVEAAESDPPPAPAAPEDPA